MDKNIDWQFRKEQEFNLNANGNHSEVPFTFTTLVKIKKTIPVGKNNMDQHCQGGRGKCKLINLENFSKVENMSSP